MQSPELQCAPSRQAVVAPRERVTDMRAGADAGIASAIEAPSSAPFDAGTSHVAEARAAVPAPPDAGAAASVARAMEGDRDFYHELIFDHGRRCAALARRLAQACGLAPWHCEAIAQAAYLHDLGKLVLPTRLFTKFSVFSAEERIVVMLHPSIGSRLITELSAHVGMDTGLHAAVSLYHHERWDGSGYPAGLRGSEIPLEARIVTLADVYDALLTPRSYKLPWSKRDALEYLSTGAGTLFDPDLVRRFVALMSAQEPGATDRNVAAIRELEFDARIHALVRRACLGAFSFPECDASLQGASRPIGPD